MWLTWMRWQPLAVYVMGWAIVNRHQLARVLDKHLVRHTNSIKIEVVPPCLHEQQKMFPRARESILHAGRHVIGFVPHDAITKRPTVFAHGDCESLGYEAQRLALNVRYPR